MNPEIGGAGNAMDVTEDAIRWPCLECDGKPVAFTVSCNGLEHNMGSEVAVRDILWSSAVSE